MRQPSYHTLYDLILAMALGIGRFDGVDSPHRSTLQNTLFSAQRSAVDMLML